MSDHENLRLSVVRLLSDVYEKLIDLDLRLSRLESNSETLPLGYSRLRITELIIECFDVEEINELAHAVDGIQHDGLTGRTRSERARALIAYCERRQMVHELLLHCKRARPRVTWPRIPLDGD